MILSGATLGQLLPVSGQSSAKSNDSKKSDDRVSPFLKRKSNKPTDILEQQRRLRQMSKVDDDPGTKFFNVPREAYGGTGESKEAKSPVPEPKEVKLTGVVVKKEKPKKKEGSPSVES